jgi:WD40 repeat protein
LFTLKSKFSIEEVRLSKDDKYIFAGSYDGKIFSVWSTVFGVKINCLESLEEAENWGLKYSEAKRLIERFLLSFSSLN